MRELTVLTSRTAEPRKKCVCFPKRNDQDFNEFKSGPVELDFDNCKRHHVLIIVEAQLKNSYIRRTSLNITPISRNEPFFSVVTFIQLQGKPV